MKTNINITGMTCAACSSRVENVLNKKDGVDSIAVNLLQQRATIEFNEDKISLEEISETIDRAGFEVPTERRSVFVKGMT